MQDTASNCLLKQNETSGNHTEASECLSGWIHKCVTFVYQLVQENQPGQCSKNNESRPVYCAMTAVQVLDTDSASNHHFPSHIQTLPSDIPIRLLTSKDDKKASHFQDSHHTAFFITSNNQVLLENCKL